VHGLGLQSGADWHEWAKSEARPDDIPADPRGTYKNKGWVSMGDWLGTGRVASFNMAYRPFREARKFVRGLGLTSRNAWETWAKSGRKPENIPANPSLVYQSKGWSGWGDWLGTGRIANFNRVYRSFHESRSFVRSLGLQSKGEWTAWAKSVARPEDIPTTPARVYQDEGWAGFGDWLGIFNLWNKNAVLSFLYSINLVLPDLEPAELYSIMRQNGMLVASKERTNSNAGLIQNIRDLCSSSNPEADFEKLVSEIEKQNAEIENEELESEEETTQVVPSEEETRAELPALRSLSALKAVDALVDAGITSDEETIEFLVANRVSGLWQAALNNDPAFELNALRTETGGTYFNTIRSRFLTQYDGAQGLAIPQVMRSALKANSRPQLDATPRRVPHSHRTTPRQLVGRRRRQNALRDSRKPRCRRASHRRRRLQQYGRAVEKKNQGNVPR